MAALYLALLACISTAAAQHGCCGPTKGEMTAFQAIAYILGGEPSLQLHETTVAYDFTGGAGKFYSNAKVLVAGEDGSHMETIVYTMSTGEAYYVVNTTEAVCMPLTLPKIPDLKPCLPENATFMGNVSIGGAQCSAYSTPLSAGVMYEEAVLTVCGPCTIAGAAILTAVNMGSVEKDVLRADLELDVNVRELSSQAVFNEPAACKKNIDKSLDFSKSIFAKAFDPTEFSPALFLLRLQAAKKLAGQ
eukprot:m.308370 g.308370  ORF g.308370 m.308370 type:complete len:247 (+) comp43878_c0_seq1:109-849(+)